MLRPYQSHAISLIKEAWFNQGSRRVLLHMPTGAGKTVCFSYILSNLTVPCIMAVRGRALVDQASRRLTRENVEHGVLMAKHWNYRPKARVQIASIDTLRARNMMPEAKVIVLDEAHINTFSKFLAQYPDALVLGVTATPYNREGLDYDTVVKPVTILELIEEGYLVRPRYFPPHAPDVSGVKIDAGEFNQKQLAAAVDQGDLIGDVVEHYQQEGENRLALCFGVNVTHSKHLAERFNKAGIKAVHCDANTPDAEREVILAEHEAGIIRVICNVGIYTTGVDMPWVSCVIDAAPTWSQIRYIQKLGRGTRPYEGKQDFIILDHAGNLHRHGPIELEGEAVLCKDLQQELKLKEEGPRDSVSLCVKCYAYYRTKNCPVCGSDKVQEIKMERQGKLKEIKTLPQEQIDIISWKREAKLKGYKRGWSYFRCLEKYGPEITKQYFKPRVVPDFIRQRINNAA